MTEKDEKRPSDNPSPEHQHIDELIADAEDDRYIAGASVRPEPDTDPPTDRVMTVEELAAKGGDLHGLVPFKFDYKKWRGLGDHNIVEVEEYLDKAKNLHGSTIVLGRIVVNRDVDMLNVRVIFVKDYRRSLGDGRQPWFVSEGKEYVVVCNEDIIAGIPIKEDD